MKIYLASSWRNEMQGTLVELLRFNGHEVYDFKNPRSGGPVRAETPEDGFSWKACDPDWRSSPGPAAAYRKMLAHPIAARGFLADFDAMRWADTCVLALPCGRSAHLEAGWMVGAGKRLVVFLPPDTDFEPELMYLIGGPADRVLALSVKELIDALARGRPGHSMSSRACPGCGDLDGCHYAHEAR